MSTTAQHRPHSQMTRTDYIDFWNEIMVPKLIPWKHIVVDGLTLHSARVLPRLEIKPGDLPLRCQTWNLASRQPQESLVVSPATILHLRYRFTNIGRPAERPWLLRLAFGFHPRRSTARPGSRPRRRMLRRAAIGDEPTSGATEMTE